MIKKDVLLYLISIDMVRDLVLKKFYGLASLVQCLQIIMVKRPPYAPLSNKF